MTTTEKKSGDLLSMVPIESFEKKYARDIQGDLFFEFPVEHAGLGVENAVL